MTNELFTDPKLDGFKTESPLRAFAEYDTTGPYLIAKGFRPSLKHLTRYLAAMEEKEGWQLLQILEADTGVPTLVFRSRNRLDTPISLGWETDDTTGALIGVTVNYNGEDVTLNRDTGRFFTVEMFDNETQTVVRRPVAEWPEWAQEMLGQYPAEPDPGAKEAMKKIDEAEKLNYSFTLKGFNSEAVRWQFANWNGNPEEALDRLRREPKLIIKKFFKEEQVNNLGHFYQVASVAAMLRLIDRYDMWEVVSLADIISDEELYKAIGRVNTKARHYCCGKLLPKKGENPADVLERHAEKIADDLGIDVCHESFQIARDHLSENVAVGLGIPPDGTPLADDPVNPKHYDGRACADIGERLSANGYQILKYCWRLGKKDDPCQELGKALWYLDSEVDLLSQKGVPNSMRTNLRGLKDPDSFFDQRIAGQSSFTAKVAFFLWTGYNARELQDLKVVIADHKAQLDCGSGLAI
jgi:hypothetical protein